MLRSRRFAVRAGLLTGFVLAVTYSYLGVYMPIFNPPLSGVPALSDSPLLRASVAVLIARDLPLSLAMFGLAVLASRLLKLASSEYAAFATLGWLLSTFVVFPFLAGGLLDFFGLMASIWYSVLPSTIGAAAAVFFSICLFGYGKRLRRN
jgi:hypothetical protein